MIEIKNYIDGNLLAPINGRSVPGINPAINTAFYMRPDSDARDVQMAVESAQKAYPRWSQTSLEERFRILNSIADIIEEKSADLAQAETDDNGKPLWLSQKVDIRRAADNFRFFATACLHRSEEAHFMPAGVQNYTLRKPLGVVACISPWNLPLYLFTWKIAPALASGNCVVAKPSEVTPLTAFLLSEICMEAGMPAGVLNVVHGDGPQVGMEMVKHPDVKAVSFTGSTRAGREIARAAAPEFKKMSLEMGGKNPNLIFADCDWDRMMKTTLQSSFSNQGQICLCGSRILVEDAIYDRFVEEFVLRTKELKVADPLDEDCKVGAIVSAQHYQKILDCIQVAKDEGAHVLSGGRAVKLSGRCADGYFIAPTILTGLGPECQTNMEEIFGPVVSIQKFSDDQEALRLANASQYGLSATIWTKNLNRAHQIAEALQVGIVWINTWLLRDLRTPFGGARNSGMGREGGWYAMDFYTEPKNICIDYRGNA